MRLPWILCLAAVSCWAESRLHPPLVFEPNRGQSGPGVEYLARAGGGTLLLSRGSMALAPAGRAPVWVELVDSRAEARWSGERPHTRM